VVVIPVGAEAYVTTCLLVPCPFVSATCCVLIQKYLSTFSTVLSGFSSISIKNSLSEEGIEKESKATVAVTVFPTAPAVVTSAKVTVLTPISTLPPDQTLVEVSVASPILKSEALITKPTLGVIVKTTLAETVAPCVVVVEDCDTVQFAILLF